MMSVGTIIKSVTDAMAVVSQIIESAENEVAWLVPSPFLVYAQQFGIIEQSKMLLQNGVRIRIIIDFSYPYIDIIQKLLDTCLDVCHAGYNHRMFMIIADTKSISSKSIITESLSMGSPIVAFWSDNATYAEFLMSVFERVWEQAIPAAQRIEELLNGRPSGYLQDGERILGTSGRLSQALCNYQESIQTRGFNNTPNQSAIHS